MPAESERRLEARFLQLVIEMYQVEGCKIVSKSPHDEGVDLIIQRASGRPLPVEVKIYRSREAPVAALRQAIEQLFFRMGYSRSPSGELVVGAAVPPAVQDEIEKAYPELVLLDIDNLANILSPYPVLSSRLDSIVRDALAFSDFRQPEPKESQRTEHRPTSKPQPTKERRSPTEVGKLLCRRIRAIPTGKSGARRFEETLTEALKYIFQNDLTGWSSQKPTHSNMSVYDLVSRVASTHDFWRSVKDHFQSRYIIFEFKNYGLKIKQGQIYTTEKYLHRPALRATAIIISVKGPDKNALAAARGAVREHGKLIINLTVADICNMLHRRDKAEDHNSILADIVDEMLIRLER